MIRHYSPGHTVTPLWYFCIIGTLIRSCSMITESLEHGGHILDFNIEEYHYNWG